MLLVGALLATLASSVAAQSTKETLQYLGVSRLDSSGTLSVPFDDLQISPRTEADADITGIYRGPLAATVPLITAPQSVRLGTKIFGFDGLTHRDQRLAGTGAYANTQFTTEPPDQALAVGGGFVVQAVNAALAIYDSTGRMLKGPTALNQFFHLRPEINRLTATFGDFTSDPRAYYDNELQRWFLTSLAIATDPKTGAFTAPTRLLIAVSQSKDPTDEWNLYSLDTTNDGREGCPCFGDQPLIGADAHGFFISTNAFSLREGFAGVQIYALSKQLLAQGAVPSVAHFNAPALTGGFPFNVQPASSTANVADDANRGIEFFTSIADIRNLLDNRVAVWAMTNTASLTEATPNVQLKSVIVKTQAFGVPPDAKQKSGPIKLGGLTGDKQQLLATNDHRMQQAVFSRGQLWSALTTAVAFKGAATPHAGIAYFGLKPSIGSDGLLRASVAQQGYLAVSGNDVFYPAIAVDGSGRAAIAFTLAGSDYYPSAAFASITANGSAGDMQVVASGTAPHDGFSGYSYFGGGGSGRTGDYSAAVADADGSLWMGVEYIPSGSRTLLSNWGTYLSRVDPEKQ
jgi:hypothetical protein